MILILSLYFLCIATPVFSSINEVNLTPAGSVSFADPLATDIPESRFGNCSCGVYLS